MGTFNCHCQDRWHDTAGAGAAHQHFTDAIDVRAQHSFFFKMAYAMNVAPSADK